MRFQKIYSINIPEQFRDDLFAHRPIKARVATDWDMHGGKTGLLWKCDGKKGTFRVLPPDLSDPLEIPNLDGSVVVTLQMLSTFDYDDID